MRSIRRPSELGGRLFANARNLFVIVDRPSLRVVSLDVPTLGSGHLEICLLRAVSLDAPTLGSGHLNHPCDIILESEIL